VTEIPEREREISRPQFLDEQLVAFVKARLAEDMASAAMAASVATGRWRHALVRSGGGTSTVMLLSEGGSFLADMLSNNDDVMAPFIARNDPARALREIAAKRRRLETYQRAALAVPTAPASEARSLRSFRDAAWRAVLADASVWADHPDYDPKWKLDS
jgi:hypothetical protein